MNNITKYSYLLGKRIKKRSNTRFIQTGESQFFAYSYLNKSGYCARKSFSYCMSLSIIVFKSIKEL